MVERSEDGGTDELVAGKYRLTRMIGRGGMGAVWEATHATLGTRVAVKFIDAELCGSDEVRQRFENEARAAAKLDSKHVVKVFDHGLMPDGRPYIVMEYLAGESLDERLARVGRLPPLETSRLVQQVCRGLLRAHAAGIVHRDLKPENVFLVWDDEDRKDIAKLVDFGIAKFMGGTLGTSSATRTGSLMGTPYYMSPEQARGLRTVDWRTDLWAIGVIAYRCVVGRLPFESEAVGDLLVKICTAPLPVPSQQSADVPPGFDAWFSRALAREPGERFASATELSEALGEVCGLPAGRREFDAALVSGAVGPSGTTPPPGTRRVATGEPTPGNAIAETVVPVVQNASGGASGARRWVWVAALAGGLAVVAVVAALALLWQRRGEVAASPGAASAGSGVVGLADGDPGEGDAVPPAPAGRAPVTDDPPQGGDAGGAAAAVATAAVSAPREPPPPPRQPARVEAPAPAPRAPATRPTGNPRRPLPRAASRSPRAVSQEEIDLGY